MDGKAINEQSTKKSYNGLNVLMLWAERQEKQYPLAEGLTYKQCQEAGGQVRKGERSTPGIYVNKQVIEKGTEEERLVPFMYPARSPPIASSILHPSIRFVRVHTIPFL